MIEVNELIEFFYEMGEMAGTEPACDFSSYPVYLYRIATFSVFLILPKTTIMNP